MADTFRCTLITPAQQVFDEEVTYVELPAFDGQMGIEPQRAPMVAKLGDGALRLDFARGESRWYFVAGGFAQMRDNTLTLLTEHAQVATDIDKAKAQSMLKESVGVVAVGDDKVAQRDREQDKARAMLALAGKQGK